MRAIGRLLGRWLCKLGWHRRDYVRPLRGGGWTHLFACSRCGRVWQWTCRDRRPRD